MLKALLTRYERAPDERVNWIASSPFILVHVLPFAAIWTGVTRFDVLLCLGLFALKMFFITAGYHRYFSHRAFQDESLDAVSAGIWRRHGRAEGVASGGPRTTGTTTATQTGRRTSTPQ